MHTRSSSLGSYLKGSWRVARTVQCRTHGAPASAAEEVVLSGKAQFEEDLHTGCICSTERVANGEIAGERQDQITLEGAWSGQLFLDEGVFLSQLDLLPGIGVLSHRTGSDCYHGTWELLSDTSFVVSWRCCSSCRSYTVTAHYTKESDASDAAFATCTASALAPLQGDCRGCLHQQQPQCVDASDGTTRECDTGNTSAAAAASPRQGVFLE